MSEEINMPKEILSRLIDIDSRLAAIEKRLMTSDSDTKVKQKRPQLTQEERNQIKETKTKLAYDNYVTRQSKRQSKADNEKTVLSFDQWLDAKKHRSIERSEKRLERRKQKRNENKDT